MPITAMTGKDTSAKLDGMNRRNFLHTGMSLAALSLASQPLHGAATASATTVPAKRGSYPGLKLGLFSYSYRMAFGSHDFKPAKKMNLFQFIEHAKALGYQGVQLDITHLTSYEPAYLAEVRAAAESRGLYIEYGSTLVESERTARELTVASQLGSSLMRTYMGFSRFERTTHVGEETTKAVEVLQALAPKAADLGLRIALENHCDATVDEMLSVINRVGSPTVGICADLGNFMIHLENPVASVTKLAPHIINTHFKDYDMKMMNWGFKSYGVPLGEGVIDLPAVLAVLVEKSHLDRITLEIVSEPKEDEATTLAWEEESVRRSYKYAREVLGIGQAV
jgi:sugar phosphate isomerase/epimerase